MIMLASVVLFVLVTALARHDGRIGTNFFRMASSLLIEFSILMIAILTSMLIRYTGAQVNKGLRLYAPIILLGLVIITFRIIFIPNSLITLLFPPLLLVFGIWQALAFRNNAQKVPKIDKYFAVASLAVTIVTFGLSIFGYVLMALQVYIWWIFQLTVLQLIIAIKDLLGKYRRTTPMWGRTRAPISW